MTIAMHASSSVTGSFSSDQLAHRLLHAQRLAEVAVQHAADPVQVAHRQRLVEMQLLAQVRDHGRVALLAGEDRSPGSPGSSCCSPKISIETKISVGTIVAMRRMQERRHGATDVRRASQFGDAI